MTRHPLWDQRIGQRLSLLREGTYRVAYVAPRPDLGTFRYRAFNPVEALKDHESLSAAYFFYSDLEILPDLADWADALVLVRAPYDQRVESLYRSFRNAGKKVFFDIDDLVFDTRYSSLVASSLGYELQEYEFNQWSAFIANIGESLSRADAALTTNTFLAQKITDFSSLPAQVVPNTFNKHQREAHALKQGSKTPGLSIGYFSGSQSHARDFGIVASALAQFLSHSPDSRLTIAGHLAIPADFEGCMDQVSRLPFMDFRDLQGAIASVDLNIVPLQNNAFTSGKSDLKYFEAGLVGTPTLASRNPVFEAAIVHDHTGFLADSSTWLTALHDIADRPAGDLLEVGVAAHADSVAKYSPVALAESLAAVFGSEK